MEEGQGKITYLILATQTHIVSKFQFTYISTARGRTEKNYVPGLANSGSCRSNDKQTKSGNHKSHELLPGDRPFPETRCFFVNSAPYVMVLYRSRISVRSLLALILRTKHAGTCRSSKCLNVTSRGFTHTTRVKITFSQERVNLPKV